MNFLGPYHRRMSVGALAGWAGATLGTWTAAAQVVRIRRHGTQGVNATTWALFLTMSAYWLAYGLVVRSPEIIASVLVAAPFLCWLLWLLDPQERTRGLVPAILIVLACAFGPAALFGWSAGVLGLGVVIVGTRMPQLLQLVRQREVVGVSVGSWLLGASSVALWLAYYLSVHHLAAAATMCAALVANLSIAALATLRQRRSPLAAAPFARAAG